MGDLNTYPRPNVAVDVALLTVLPSDEPKTEPGTLVVLTQERSDAPRGAVLPGRFLREDETIAECVATTLREKVGIDPGAVEPRLLRVFDSPSRDPRGWTISLAHYLVLPLRVLEAAAGQLVPVDHSSIVTNRRALLFDHREIVREAAAAMRERYEIGPDPDGLLDGPFSLAELRYAHEAVIGEQLRRDTFRRRMEPSLEQALDVAGRALSRHDGGRPARLWTTMRQVELGTPDRVRIPRT